MKFSTLLLASIVPLVVGCGGDDAGHGTTHDAGNAQTDVPVANDTPAVTTDTPTTTDTPATTDVPTAPTDTGAAVPVLAGCTASDYVDRGGDMDDRTVVPRGTTGYTPRCVTIRAGQMVTFSMDFATHPLSAGVPHGSSTGATTPSPIMTQRSGSSYVVAFPSAGFYPFYCLTHGHVGMAGVVRVIP